MGPHEGLDLPDRCGIRGKNYLRGRSLLQTREWNGEIWVDLKIEVFRADEDEVRSLGYRPTSGKFRHDPREQKSWSDPARNRTQLASVGDKKSEHYTTTDPADHIGFLQLLFIMEAPVEMADPVRSTSTIRTYSTAKDYPRDVNMRHSSSEQVLSFSLKHLSYAGLWSAENKIKCNQHIFLTATSMALSILMTASDKSVAREVTYTTFNCICTLLILVPMSSCWCGGETSHVSWGCQATLVPWSGAATTSQPRCLENTSPRRGRLGGWWLAAILLRRDQRGAIAVDHRAVVTTQTLHSVTVERARMPANSLPLSLEDSVETAAPRRTATRAYSTTEDYRCSRWRLEAIVEPHIPSGFTSVPTWHLLYTPNSMAMEMFPATFFKILLMFKREQFEEMVSGLKSFRQCTTFHLTEGLVNRTVTDERRIAVLRIVVVVSATLSNIFEQFVTYFSVHLDANSTSGMEPPSEANIYESCGFRNHAGRCRCSADFLGGLPFPSPLHYGATSCSPHLTLISYQDLTKSR
ncbi:hypothetical protein PR048_033310 [Dryococelus australis]|uniref:Uncharacterized protein n=1 Tax=Dryococelus australis TaxID=614101 RepID=A0ABQ9G0W3_9NEOP|nr:hypothetical protein PR048_033310 [Dryococelus australis]